MHAYRMRTEADFALDVLPRGAGYFSIFCYTVGLHTWGFTSLKHTVYRRREISSEKLTNESQTNQFHTFLLLLCCCIVLNCYPQFHHLAVRSVGEIRKLLENFRKFFLPKNNIQRPQETVCVLVLIILI